MAINRKIPYSEGVFFITFTCYDWIPIIDMVNGYDLVYGWFDHLKSIGNYIIGYQVMPNHLHALIAFVNSGKNINRQVGEGKRFMAYEFVNRLIDLGELELLRKLNDAVSLSNKARGKMHEIWEASFDWKYCQSEKFICQKLDYMHNNPCVGKWNLVKNPADYKHSSAGFYSSGEPGEYPVTHYHLLRDIDLSKV